jgi:hypothetical protein
LFQYSLMKSLYRDVEKMRKELKKYKKTYWQIFPRVL